MMNIPITKLYISQGEKKAISSVIKSGWLMQGERIDEFECKFADYVGAKYAVVVSSGTAALHLSLLALNIGYDDEVIIPSFSFIATANAVVYTGAKPVFVDIDPRTYNIDYKKIEYAISSKTKAIIPVHQAGLPADMDNIINIAKKYKLNVIEDAACALGSEYNGKKIGSLSKLTCFSFHPRKIISTGEGGMVTTNDSKLASRIMALRQHYLRYENRNSKRLPSYNEFAGIGYNYRMTDLQAAIGISQLSKLDKILERRRKLASRYDSAFKAVDFLIPPYIPYYAKPNYQSYILRIDKDYAGLTDKIIKYMLKNNIHAKAGITSIHKQVCYKRLIGSIKLPETEKATNRTIILPLYPQLKKNEQDYVIRHLLNILKRVG